MGGLDKGEDFWGGGNITGLVDVKNTPLESAITPNQIIAARRDPALLARTDQIIINQLGLMGGRPYVDKRLSRFGAESKYDWEGGTRKDGAKITGRKQRTHNTPLLGRIVSKINQFVFAQSPVREGADKDVLKNISSDRLNINQFMKNTSEMFSSSGWCWISVDVPSVEGELSVKQKNDMKIRPYWTLWNPLSIVDWKISDTGIVEWILTEFTVTTDENPRQRPTVQKKRLLWEPGVVTEYLYNKDGSEIMSSIKKEVSLKDVVPFVPVGNISPKPIGFDDLESINRTILDLESCNRENYFKSVYCLLKLPDSSLQSFMNTYNVKAEVAVSMMVGEGNPILMRKDDPEPGYIMPPADSLKTIRLEIQDLKGNMFESVGLMLKQMTKQVESADAKAWDHLDADSVMSEYATILEDAEQQAVDLSKAWDKDFKEWEPVYNRKFDIGDYKNEIEALVIAGNMSMPDDIYKEVLKKVVDRIDKVGGRFTNEERDEFTKIIDEWEISKPSEGFETIDVESVVAPIG